jgi:hypothetical protein
VEELFMVQCLGWAIWGVDYGHKVQWVHSQIGEKIKKGCCTILDEKQVGEKKNVVVIQNQIEEVNYEGGNVHTFQKEREDERWKKYIY